VRRTSSNSVPRRALYRYVDWRDKRDADAAPFSTVPPADLRYRVHGDLDLASFLETGKQCSRDIQDALARVDKDIGSFERILDFGCGCARTLLWLAPWADRSQFSGTDIDEQAIVWCRRSIDFSRFTINAELPPLPVSSESYDLIYAVSVFTHLTEQLQFRWLDELRRVSVRDGYVLLTIRGVSFANQLSPRDADELRSTGFVFSRMPDYVQKMFPDWYQSATHTENYVRERWGEFFEVVDYIPRLMDGSQDVVVLRNS
jgi:SAM-dependent methyltransferase